MHRKTQTDNRSSKNLNGQVKRRRRTREERGLPSDRTIAELAETYLESQNRLWPELVRSQILPANSEKAVSELVADFKRRFLSPDPFPIVPETFGWHRIAASYSRYSDPNSNPRSLSQQLKLQLERARQNEDFIPWMFVLADAEVSATTSKRRGYELAKDALADSKFSISTLYIDELGRASRDAVESLMLGKLLEGLQKRLIGVSDGFNSGSGLAKMQLQMFAMLHEWFVDQLRCKVNRGMDDAFERGGNVGLPAPGYKLVPLLDQRGAVVRGADGDQINALAIDKRTAKIISKIFFMYVDKRMSPEQIGKFLNGIEFMGCRTWDGCRVRKILRRRTYIGVLTYRMTRHIRNRTTGTVKVVQRPTKEWKVRRARHLQIVPYKVWKKAATHLAEGAAAWSRNRNSRVNRAEVYPETLVRPRCGCCGGVMSLGRSGKYASFTCLNGLHGKHGCTYRGFKTVAIVERTILRAIRERILTPETIDILLSSANSHLDRLSKVPKVSTKSEKVTMKKLSKQRDSLYKLAKQGRELKSLAGQIQKLDDEIDKLRESTRLKELQNSPVPGPVTRAEIEGAMNNLRDLLEQDVAAAAPILREITGPIDMEQIVEEGKTKPTWVAKFTVNMVPVLANLSAHKNCPNTGTWEFLNTRGWMMPQSVSVLLGRGGKNEAFVCAVQTLAEKKGPSRPSGLKRA